MRILIQTKSFKARYIDIGYKTRMFRQMYFITSGILFFDKNNAIEYATMDFHFLRGFKYWKLKK